MADGAAEWTEAVRGALLGAARTGTDASAAADALAEAWLSRSIGFAEGPGASTQDSAAVSPLCGPLAAAALRQGSGEGASALDAILALDALRLCSSGGRRAPPTLLPALLEAFSKGRLPFGAGRHLRAAAGPAAAWMSKADPAWGKSLEGARRERLPKGRPAIDPWAAAERTRSPGEGSGRILAALRVGPAGPVEEGEGDPADAAASAAMAVGLRAQDKDALEAIAAGAPSRRARAEAAALASTRPDWFPVGADLLDFLAASLPASVRPLRPHEGADLRLVPEDSRWRSFLSEGVRPERAAAELLALAHPGRLAERAGAAPSQILRRLGGGLSAGAHAFRSALIRHGDKESLGEIWAESGAYDPHLAAAAAALAPSDRLHLLDWTLREADMKIRSLSDLADLLKALGPAEDSSASAASDLAARLRRRNAGRSDPRDLLDCALFLPASSLAALGSLSGAAAEAAAARMALKTEARRSA